MSKNSTQFWKTWNNKVSNKQVNKIRIEGNIPEDVAVNKLYDIFKACCCPNSTDFNITMQDKFLKLFNNYVGDKFIHDEPLISVEDIKWALQKNTYGYW